MRADARRNYARILDTAREAFAAHGPEAPLDEIARRAGVGAGTLYRHFPHRKALIEAVYRDEIAVLGNRAHDLAEAYPPGEALEIWVRDLVEFTLRRRGLAVTLKAALDEDSETFAWCKDVAGEAAGLLVGNAQAAGVIRADIDARDLLYLAHGVAVAAHMVWR